jgi:hypothetical protein
MHRERYSNGDSIGMAWNGCDGCSPIYVNGVLCHEPSCPESWRDYLIECRECGCDFIREDREQVTCSDCQKMEDPHFIPAGIEVFYRTIAENREYGVVDSDGDPLDSGWYWWSCFPGCLPDSEPMGPFDSEIEAIADSKGW